VLKIDDVHTTMATRPLDVVVFGATGFTGVEVALALARGAAPGLTWAIAGRSSAKLKFLAARCEAQSMDHGTRVLPPIIVADLSDEQSLLAMAQKCRLVLNCTGPYRYSRGLCMCIYGWPSHRCFLCKHH